MHTANLKENGLLQPVHLLTGRGEDFLQNSYAKMEKLWSSLGWLVLTDEWKNILPGALFYPEMVKAQIPTFAAMLSLELSYDLPTAGYFVWGSSFL